MAIYHYSAKIVSRGAGQSVINSLAYINKEKEHDERLDRDFDYSKGREQVRYRETLAPEDLMDKYETPEKIWNAIEARETGKTAQLAQRLDIALPRDLTPEQQIALAHDWAERMRTEEHRVVSWALHDDEGGNPHIDALISLREYRHGEWSGKSRLVYDKDKDGNRILADKSKGDRHKYKRHYDSINGKQFIERSRERWQECCNMHLARAGLDVRIDHRTLDVQRAEQMQLAADAERRGDLNAMQKHAEAAIALDRTPQRKEYNRDSLNAQYNSEARAADAERQQHELDVMHKYVKRAKHDAYYRRLHARQMFTERTRETLAKKYGCEPTAQEIGKAIARERIDTRRADMFADLCAPTSTQMPQHEIAIYRSADELMKRERMTQEQLASFLFKTKLAQLQKNGIKLDYNKQNKLKRDIKHAIKHGKFDKCAFVVAKPLQTATKAAAASAKVAVMPIKATKQVLDTIQSVARCIPIVGKPLASAVGVAKSPVDAAAKVADAVEKVADKTQRKTRRRQEPEQERPQRGQQGQQQQGNQGNDKQSKSDGKDADAISADGHIQGYDDLWDVDLKFVSEMERDRILAERERAKTI